MPGYYLLCPSACTDGASKGSRRHAQDQAARSPAAHSSSPKRRTAGSPSLLPDSLVKPQRLTQHDVNLLLNQRPGKLQTKDIKAGSQPLVKLVTPVGSKRHACSMHPIQLQGACVELAVCVVCSTAINQHGSLQRSVPFYSTTSLLQPPA